MVGRYLREDLKKRLYIQHEPRITTKKAEKITNEWLKLLDDILNWNEYTLLRCYHAYNISRDIRVSKRIVQRALLMAEREGRYSKTRYFSEETFRNVISYKHQVKELREIIEQGKIMLQSFMNMLRNTSIGFDTVKEISQMEPRGNYIYDVTMENGKFFTTEGILNHNSHVWLSEKNPSPEGIYELTKKIATKTAIQYFAFTKDLSVCSNCNFTSGGLVDTCPNCSSKNIDWWSRITGYYQNVAGWNKGKLAELRDRRRYGTSDGSEELPSNIKKKLSKEGKASWNGNLDF